MRSWTMVVTAAAVLAAGVSVSVAQRAGAFDQSINHPAIRYSTSDADTPVDRLNQKLKDGSAKLVYDEKSGYLKSVLDLLDIPVESQVLVYTQTSLQAQHIRMDNPRAIYFNDTVSVAYIRGAGLLEIVAQDAKLGSVFYVVHQTPVAGANFGREQQCLRCHLSWDTLGVPGLTVLTTFPRKSTNDYANGGVVDHYKPIEERWGGWYVTGRKVPAKHMGNLPLIMSAPVSVASRVSLAGQFDLTGYLTPYSDIVSLMVFEHQAHLSNLITRATWETRLGNPMRIAEAAAAIADYMLFVDEARIESAIEGSSGFAEKFSARGKLHQLDLTTRLQKYPLSYMIYSPVFKSLPDAPKNLVMGTIEGVLSGEISGPKYAHFTPAVREAIRSILKETLR